MRVVITGGAGRVGRATGKAMVAAGHEVHILDRVSPYEGRGWGHKFGWYRRTELTDPAQVLDQLLEIKPDAIIHLAADPAPYGHPRHRQLMDNLAITHLVLQTAGDLEVPMVVVASSEMASGWSSRHVSPPRIPFNEDDVIESGNHYAMSKRLGEVMAENMAHLYPKTGFISLRINLVILAEDCEWLRRRVQHVPGAAGNLWGYVTDTDAAEAFRLAAESDLKGHHVFMVAADDAFTELPTRQAFASHFDPLPEFDPALAEFGSAIDCSRIKAALGWQPKLSWRDLLAAEDARATETEVAA